MNILSKIIRSGSGVGSIWQDVSAEQYDDVCKIYMLSQVGPNEFALISLENTSNRYIEPVSYPEYDPLVNTFPPEILEEIFAGDMADFRKIDSIIIGTE